MTEYLGALVAVLGVVSIILKQFFSDEAKKTVKNLEIEAKQKSDEKAIEMELESQAALSEGASKAWEAADNESQNFEGSSK